MRPTGRPRTRRPVVSTALWGGGILLLWAVLAFVQNRLFQTVRGGGLLETLAVFGVINFNILLLLLLLFLTFRNLIKLAFERRRGVLGARLKTKLVLAFLAMTMIPTAILYVVSAGFLARSIESWFSTRVDGALRQALHVARAYYRVEEDRVLRSCRQIARELGGGGPEAPDLHERLSKAVLEQGVGAVAVFSAQGELTGWASHPQRSARQLASGAAQEAARALAGRELSGVVR
ncbi:MAG: hypothetical protein HY900_02860, partial [Deltaproteobacteria bacterium]|nr:hypothetical protein [Deltaproteobacteria bacterium]